MATLVHTRVTLNEGSDAVQTFGDHNQLYFVPRFSLSTPSTDEITEPTSVPDSERSTIILGAEDLIEQTAGAEHDLDNGDDNDENSHIDGDALAGPATRTENIDLEEQDTDNEAAIMERSTAYDSKEREQENAVACMLRSLRPE